MRLDPKQQQGPTQQAEHIPALSGPCLGAAINTPALDRLAELADQLAESATAAGIRELLGRINEGRFFVACVGQFKRGKSTLLNALVDEAILPSGVVPVTTVPTVLRFGDRRSARVLIGGEWQNISTADLAHYVSEELNPENRKRIEGVEVFLPSSSLATGMCLVDTPGIGSVFSGNTEATKAFIPQIDAAILVVGADPPISGEELELIEAVAGNVDRILVVLNKIDRVSAEEARQAATFARKVLQARLSRLVERIYEVSALNRLNHSGDGDDWNLFAGDLGSLAARSGQEMMRSAAARALHRFSASLQRSIEERLRALKQPIEDSERRIAKLRQTAGQAEQSLRDLGALFSAEQMRLSNTLLARRKKFFAECLAVARDEFAREAKAVATDFGPTRRRELMALAQAIARRHVMPWLDAEEAQAEELYRQLTQRFVELVNGLLLRISQEQSADFGHLPRALDMEQGFRTRSRFYFHDMITIARPASPLLYSVDAVMGVLRIDRWFRKDAEGFLEELLDTNASRVQGDVEQRVVESRRRLESEVRKLLREVITTAEQAFSSAREIITAGATTVAQELERLHRLAQELEALTSGS